MHSSRHYNSFTDREQFKPADMEETVATLVDISTAITQSLASWVTRPQNASVYAVNASYVSAID